jgi:hypothetical protein
MVSIDELTIAEPIVRAAGLKFAVNVELETLTRLLIILVFIVLLPINSVDVDSETLAPTVIVFETARTLEVLVNVIPADPFAVAESLNITWVFVDAPRPVAPVAP